MSYRNITVDGVDYKYIVGKTHVKVNGIGAATKDEVGAAITYDESCECCGEPTGHSYTKTAVQPSHVAGWIRSKVQG